MKPDILVDTLRKLNSSDRYEILFGGNKKSIELQFNCRILYLPTDCLGHLPRNINYLLVSDPKNSTPFLAIITTP